MTPRSFIAVAASVAVLAPAISVFGAASAQADQRVRLLGTTTLPAKLTFQGTTVGGLSGIDRDPRSGRYALISDDRSQLNPARFYTAAIDVSAKGIGVRLVDTKPFKRIDGKPYPSPAQWQAEPCTAPRVRCDRLATVDPEDIRFDPRSSRLWWSQEGDRQLPMGGTPLVNDPSIRSTTSDGSYRGQLPLPRNYHITTENKGPRANLGIEGFTFADHGRLVTSIVEGPLLQDGPAPSVDKGGFTRLTVQSRQGRVVGQYAYELDAVGGANGENGAAAILADPRDPQRYLVLERTVVLGKGNRIRIYEASLRGATDVYRRDSLADAKRVRPVRKHLLADLTALGLQQAGIVEGMTWGPSLRTGERTLVLVADDNFVAREIPGVPQVSQFIALAVR
ncbi:esterase-like activity of phytase family protein [Actinomadura hibisca]|uniref:esterase-like activity of phytase family protein n=1 Tax=Actinomadura hibisca TaxID=68565 RepID=UPI00082965BB|nr:esterase-like activity of phytase family protein [Actinomadura hibisca]